MFTELSLTASERVELLITNFASNGALTVGGGTGVGDTWMALYKLP